LNQNSTEEKIENSLKVIFDFGLIKLFLKLEFLLGPGPASVVNDNASANVINDVKRNVKNEKNDLQENENRFTFYKVYNVQHF
jgi:hypothetical protein